MTNRRRTQAGMTLIEVLIATTLFGMLSAGILLSLRVGLNAMDRANGKLMENRKAAYASRIVYAQLKGLMPEQALFRVTPQSPVQQMMFFQGEPQSMRFVSSYSLQDAGRGYPQILEFQVIPGASGQGVRLVVNEVPYTGPASAGAMCLGYVRDPLSTLSVPIFKPIQAGPGSFVLADKLAYCRFLFEFQRAPATPPVWLNHWTIQQWPLAIRIEMAPLELDASKVQPMTVTSTMHINRDMGTEYVDE